MPVQVQDGSPASLCSRTGASWSWTLGHPRHAAGPAPGTPTAVTVITSRPAGRIWPPSIRSLPVGVAVHRALEDLRGGRDLGLGRLQDRLSARAGPGGECRTQVAVVGVVGRDGLAVPVGEPAGEGPVPGSQVGDPLVDLARRLVRGEGEFVALGAGRGLGLLPGAEDSDERGAGGADVGVRLGPAAGVAAGPWWWWCRWLWVRCRCQVSVTSVTAARAACSSTMALPAA